MIKPIYAALLLCSLTLSAAAAPPRQTETVLWNRIFDIPSALPLMLYAMEATLADYGNFRFSVSGPVEQQDVVQGLADNSLRQLR